METASSKPSQSFVLTLIIFMIISGAANTLVYKVQNTTSQSVDDTSYNYPEPVGSHAIDTPYQDFNHPFMQAVTMFMGEAIVIFIFFFTRKSPQFKADSIQAQAEGYQQFSQNKLNNNSKYFWLAIPAMCDLFSSTCAYVALNYISPSVYQMLRGGAIITTALMSKFFLKKVIKNYQIIGCGMVLFGITLVGASGFIFPMSSSSEQSSTAEQVIAIVLLLLSVVGNGLQFVSEEKLFDKYFLTPFEVVGVEGCWGLITYILLTTILTFTPCPDAMKANCLPYDGTFYFERADLYFRQCAANIFLMIWVILGVFTIATFNIAGVSVTKYVSSLARSLVDVSRTVLIWIVAIIVTLTIEGKKWENTRWQAIIMELIGFVILISGNLIYNAIIKLKSNANEYKVEDAPLLNESADHGQSLQG